MRKQLPVSILVVSYNTRAMTLACLASVAAEAKGAYEIIVVDNASTDGSAQALAEAAKADPRITVLALPKNAGFARGNNIAAEHASGQRLLLLNPDTLVLDGAIDRLLAAAEARPQARVWGGKTILPDGRVDGSCVWRDMDLWGVFCRTSGLAEAFPDSGFWNREAYGGWQRDSAQDVDIIAGCFLLIDRPLWDELKGFDPLFFMYGEEADLCRRAVLAGARPHYTPEAVIIHYGGASEATRAGKIEKLLQGKVTLMQRHWQPAARLAGQALLALWPLSRWLALCTVGRLRNRPDCLERAAVWRAVWQSRRAWLLGYVLPPGLVDGPVSGAATPRCLASRCLAPLVPDTPSLLVRTAQPDRTGCQAPGVPDTGNTGAADTGVYALVEVRS